MKNTKEKLTHEREREISNLFEEWALRNSTKQTKEKYYVFPFLAIFAKNSEKKGEKQAFTFKF